jgi:hypothetical protein
MIIDKIRANVRNGRYNFSDHAVKRMIKREIDRHEIEEALFIEKRKSNAMGVSAILKNVNGCLIVLTRTSPFGKGGMRGISSAIKSPLAPLC